MDLRSGNHCTPSRICCVRFCFHASTHLSFSLVSHFRPRLSCGVHTPLNTDGMNYLAFRSFVLVAFTPGFLRFCGFPFFPTSGDQRRPTEGFFLHHPHPQVAPPISSHHPHMLFLFVFLLLFPILFPPSSSPE